MIISEKHKIIFGGIERSASTSVHYALKCFNNYKQRDPTFKLPYPVLKDRTIYPNLKQMPFLKHAPFEVAQAYIPNIKDYYCFCIFRNPWEMMVSRYAFHKAKKHNHKTESWFKSARQLSFLDWIKTDGHIALSYNIPAIKTFEDFICDKKENIISDCIYNFEFIGDMFIDLSKRFKIKIKPKTSNASSHRNYVEYYENDHDVIKTIGDQFKFGIDLFGFKFGVKSKVQCAWLAKDVKHERLASLFD